MINDFTHWLSREQFLVIAELMKGEEGEWFASKLTELAKLIESMPVTYQQDSLGDKAVAFLHYFVGNCDWWLTEKDVSGDPQQQAFGLARMGGDAELGYISIPELLAVGVELDLHFPPTTVGEITSRLINR